MTDLPDFLLARIAEDEDVVRHCLEAVDADRTEYAQQLARRTGPLSTTTSASHCGQDMGPRGTVEATPGRVLAECEAKRQIVEPWGTAWTDDLTGSCSRRNEDNWRDGIHADAHDAVLRILALPYADHPDYREEWRA